MPINKWKAISVALLGVALGTLITLPVAPRQRRRIPVTPAIASTRKVYPYSVISGGVGSAVELRNALFHDTVAARHYADFRLDQTRSETLLEPKKLFVSYRIADRIYWTRKRLLVPKGETILTDGASAARTRCGNRLSETPQLPVSAEWEPAAEVLNSESLEPAPAVANLPVNEDKDSSWTDKLVSTVPPSGDLLSKFGPESTELMSGSAYRTGATNGGGAAGGATGMNTGGGASGGTGGGSGTTSGGVRSTVAAAPGPGASGTVGGIMGGVASGFPVSPSGTSVTTSLPVGSSAPLPSVNVLPVGFTQQLPPSTGVFYFPVLPIVGYLPQPIAEQLINPYVPASAIAVLPPASVSNLSHPATAINHPLTPAILNPASINVVEAPEPRTLALALGGMTLLLLGLLRNRLVKRRALP